MEAGTDISLTGENMTLQSAMSSHPVRWALRALVLLHIAHLAPATPYLLPDDVTPIHYAVTIDVEDNCTFSGKVSIDVFVQNSTDTVELHSNNLNVYDASIYFRKNKFKENDFQNYTEDVSIDLSEFELSEFGTRKVKELYTNKGKKKNVLTIKLEETLKEGSMYKIVLSYDGLMTAKKTWGIYCQPYQKNNTVRWLSSAFFEPNAAQKAFPCWDEPRYKAKFTITIIHSNYTTALSNMPKRTSLKLKSGVRKGSVIDTFYTTPKMPVYLVNFLVSEFASQSTNYTRFKKMTVWCQPDKLYAAQPLLHYGAHHLKFLEYHFGIRDPLPKQDFIAIKNLMAGGLENWGLISFRGKAVLLEGDAIKSQGRLMAASNLIAHELAHIWFGNMVTPSTWKDIWLSEGFATFYSILAVDYLNPKWDYTSLAATRSMIVAFRADEHPSTHPLVPDETPEKLTDIFDLIAYYKGGMIARMLNLTLGGHAMREGMTRYLTERQYGSASHLVLWRFLTEAGHKAQTLPANLTLAQLMESWTRQPGHPVVTVTRNYRTGDLTITQASVLHTKPNHEGWWIPLSYTYEGAPANQKNRFWLDPSIKEFTMRDPASPKQWLLFNVEAAGFYRVRYDSRNVNRLRNAVRNNSLSVMDEVGLLYDVVTSTGIRSGSDAYPNLGQALEMAEAVRGSKKPLPWAAALAALLPIYLGARESTATPKLQAYMNELIGSELDKTELAKADYGDLKKEWLVKLGCAVGLPRCTQQAVNLFTQWRHSSKQFDIPEDVRYAVLCSSIRSWTDDSAWHVVHKRLNYTHDKHTKRDMIQALACTKNKEILKYYVDWAIDGGKSQLTGRNMELLLKAVAEEDVTVVLESLSSASTPRLYKKDSKWQSLLETLALEVRNERQLGQLRRLLEVKSNLSAKSTLSSVSRLAETNIDWNNKGIRELDNWLTTRPKTIDIRSTD